MPNGRFHCRGEEKRFVPADRASLPESFGARFSAPIKVPKAFSTEIISAVRGLEERSGRDERGLVGRRQQHVSFGQRRTQRSVHEREREKPTTLGRSACISSRSTLRVNGERERERKRRVRVNRMECGSVSLSDAVSSACGETCMASATRSVRFRSYAHDPQGWRNQLTKKEAGCWLGD